MALIETKGLGKVYRFGDVEIYALKDVSLSIDSGEFVAVMGASGSGKSTFMNLIGCLDKPTSGEYRLDGVDVNNLSSDELSEIRNKKIGFIFQGFNLLQRTKVIENVELPMLYAGLAAKKRRELALEALRSVGLEQKAFNYPTQLSGGQQQRIAIARALVNNASIILADEPTGNLDTKTSYEIMDLFTKLNNGLRVTLILVTHEPDIASFARRIIKFSDGAVVSDEEVKK
ncbi:MAG: ABC transporter ATP-binding protein [Dissulfurimicrobium sp.]|uniref:ABC transporter ATP-binding protein n=1 Tax=Dissulfurimicrobium TaxID=1769732 RepID=UPI001EDAD363|nr:ABC transporter ATP-binding protein [Dissulfurimicrobium hydrothermale]UKL13222.1 ABC transporter ATP-binding protein [Dissulfurimicrobium hydrothermale]